MAPDIRPDLTINFSIDGITFQEVGKAIGIDYAVQDSMMSNDFYRYIDDLYTKEEEKDMNKVLELYVKRKKEEIDKKYEEKVNKDYNGLELVAKYNQIVAEFEERMEELYHNELNVDESTIKEVYSASDYKYQIRETTIKSNLCDIYNDDRNKEIKDINDLVEEVEAQLSLSSDLEYQKEVLITYGIIDKKTGKIK